MDYATRRRKLAQFAVCDCRIDSHCLHALRGLAEDAKNLFMADATVATRLQAVADCPCYMAAHCIDNLIDLIEALEKVPA